METLAIDELIQLERDNGIACGPFHRAALLERAPQEVRRDLDLARRFPEIVAARQGFASMDVNDFPPTNFTAVTASATETNLWTPAIWTPIPANDMRAGKVYKVSCGGIISTTTGTNNLTITPRCGQSATPSSNVALGASTAVTMTVSLSSVPWYAEFTMGIRSLGLAASGAAATGNGFIVVGDVTTTAGKMLAFGSTVAATVDNTAATGLVLSATWSAVSNSIQANWVVLRSYN